MDIEQYIKEQEEKGYIDENGKPLKCGFCNGKDLTNINYMVGPLGVEEYIVECDKCKKVVGYWAYGYWQV